MSQWRWTLCEEFKNGVTKVEQHAGQREELRDAMNDVANTVEYMLEEKEGCYYSPNTGLAFPIIKNIPIFKNQNAILTSKYDDTI